MEVTHNMFSARKFGSVGFRNCLCQQRNDIKPEPLVNTEHLFGKSSVVRKKGGIV
jgi:hypothetical protein